MNRDIQPEESATQQQFPTDQLTETLQSDNPPEDRPAINNLRECLELQISNAKEIAQAFADDGKLISFKHHC